MELTRRDAFNGVFGRVAAAAGLNHVLTDIAIDDVASWNEQTIITIFLRGGADGLSIAAPVGDDAYHRNRKLTNIASAGSRDGVTPLDARFCLHPAMRSLEPLYSCGELALIHACGSADSTRSHFEAMSTVERGISDRTGPASGWLARHLQSAPWRNTSPMRAVAVGSVLPASLVGAPGAASVQSVKQEADVFRQEGPLEILESLYGGSYAETDAAGSGALSVLRRLVGLQPGDYAPRVGVRYPDSELGRAMQQLAVLLRARIGLEAGCVDHYGYDTHVVQGGESGALASQLRDLGTSIMSFVQDIGRDLWSRTTLVVMSEFGRRVAENGGGGTDHGHGGVMMVAGGGGSIVGGRVHGRWPGIEAHELVGPGDLAVTTDYRQVLSEVLLRRCGNTGALGIFPDLKYLPIGIVAA